MKKHEIKVGGLYRAAVNGKVVTVRVESIRPVSRSSGFKVTGGGVRDITLYDVTNLATGRKTVFRSAQKFRSEATSVPTLAVPLHAAALDKLEAEQRPTKGTTPEQQNQQHATAIAVEKEERRAEDENRSDPTTTPPSPAAPPSTASTSGASATASSSEPTASASATPAAPGAGTAPTSQFARLAASASGRSSSDAATVAGYTPTEEQRAVLQVAVQPGLRCLVMPAGAGAGKTSTLKMLEEVLPGRGQYTAFNKSLVSDSKSKFRKARCSTTHGLAFGTVGKRFASRLNSGRMRSEQVASRLGIADLELTVSKGLETKPHRLTAGFLAGQVMLAVRRFCQSADRAMAPHHFKLVAGIDEAPDRTNNEVVREYLLPFAEKAWADLSNPNGGLPFSHDVYVKLWQLGEGPDKPFIAADYILLDEAQDTAPVFLDVLRQQAHALLIFVGDSNQAIYEWRGAVDAMRAFPGAPRRQLSQSFRFGQRVADVANSILAGLDEPTDLVLRGLESLPSIVSLKEPLANPKCVLTRTNAAAIGTVLEAQARGKRTHLIASVEEVTAFVRAAKDLKTGKPTSHPELGCFGDWNEVVEYSKTDEGEELRLWVKLIEEFTCDAIITALTAQATEAEADLVVCTAHKSKGREWDSVKLASDFPPACRMSDSDRRLLYVAATRAKLALDLSGCPPFHVYVSKEDGAETPGIKVAFTGPMPVLDDRTTTPVASPVAEAPAPEPKPAPSASTSNGHSKTFSWANYNGKWHVGGPSGAAGTTVEVERKNGTRSQERLGKIIRDFGVRCIYEVTTK